MNILFNKWSLIHYFVCNKCGRYELQLGESPEAFEECQCGGKLKYYKK